MPKKGTIPWIKDETAPGLRKWEEYYRNRWQHDKIVRSTHGVNCTGGCSWGIYVKDGIVTWEMQQLDYPKLEPDLPAYEPRGCQRGISFSWYLYSPLRVKYPYVRGVLLDLWREARRQHDDPVDAWAAVVDNQDYRSRWQRARGKGGLRRASWDEALDIIAAANLHTIKRYGPDRIAGFSPIPAMSMISYAAGARLMQLMGGVALSFYDWYCDLPNASPEIWGEQTDVHESADWYNAKLLAICGSNLNMTRTPDCHFAVEARHNGSKMWVFSPDFSQVAKHADDWVPVNAGQDGAWWMAVNHVLLKEFYHDRQVPYFVDYAQKYTDAPILVELVQDDEDQSYRPGQVLRANRLPRYTGVEHGDWKVLMWDNISGAPRMPLGSLGFRWQQGKGQWNLKPEDGLDGSAVDPALSFIDNHTDTVSIRLDDFGRARECRREVPARSLKLADGSSVLVTTVFDLMMAQYGVSRGLGGDYPAGYDDDLPYTPAWSEKYTGMGRKTLIRFAREWADTAERTQGKCMVIIGAGVNHWYHANLMYRACIGALMLCGCVGVNGGGLAHYVGQEKVAPVDSWASVALAKDWFGPSRLQNSPSWHYVHSDQWRYERDFTDYHTVPRRQPDDTIARGHAMDLQAQAVRSGWLPFFPQFNENPLHTARKAADAGAADESAVSEQIVARLKSGDLKLAVDDPDAPENWPRVWFIWRGNAIMSSAKGHEYFLKHYLGTHSNTIADDSIAEDSIKTIEWHKSAPQGKMDLIVDVNFRMDTSALYSDIILPAATWYEKHDLNSTDLHSFIHPLSAAVPPCWESKSDWQTFRAIAERFSALAGRHFPKPVEDVVMAPLLHDTPDEMAQPNVADWRAGEVEAIPGKTMPRFKVVRRDYANLHNQFISYGPLIKSNGLGGHGTNFDVSDIYERALTDAPKEEWSGTAYPSLKEDLDVCNTILRFSSVTNGELSHRAFVDMENRVGQPLARLGEKARSVRMDFDALLSRPNRILDSPLWSGLTADGRPYAPYTLNVEHLVPWRTLTGRQHFYLDHPLYLQFGEHLPTFKPKPMPAALGDLSFSEETGNSRALSFITPHSKWHIHSTYGDTERMTTLSRGADPLWISEADAEAIGIVDNDWVEVHNDHGVVVTRAAVTSRVPPGLCIQYHSPERTYGVPKSPVRNNRRAGAHNSLIRARLKPNFMAGGYAQFTYYFNYWGPVGSNRDTQVIVRKLPRLVW